MKISEINVKQNKNKNHMLLSAYVKFQALRATDYKYQKSHDRGEISGFILFYLNFPFGELFSKITIKSSTTLSFF